MHLQWSVFPRWFCYLEASSWCYTAPLPKVDCPVVAASVPSPIIRGAIRSRACEHWQGRGGRWILGIAGPSLGPLHLMRLRGNPLPLLFPRIGWPPPWYCTGPTAPTPRSVPQPARPSEHDTPPSLWRSAASAASDSCSRWWVVPRTSDTARSSHSLSILCYSHSMDVHSSSASSSSSQRLWASWASKLRDASLRPGSSAPPNSACCLFPADQQLLPALLVPLRSLVGLLAVACFFMAR